MIGEIYKSVQADKTQLLFLACGSEYIGILVSFSKYSSTCKFLWKSVPVLRLHSSWLSVHFSVPRKWICGFWKESAGVISAPYKWPNYRLNFFSHLSILAVCTQVSQAFGHNKRNMWKALSSWQTTCFWVMFPPKISSAFRTIELLISLRTLWLSRDQSICFKSSSSYSENKVSPSLG